ncbi:CocE/NonD family hydrolase [Rhodococcus hoagii]|nr:CocE/NonD family hydrolase [Prescottella equi]NKS72004.1 CocE/NonD family hydrolase [Prescottella equi]
MKNAMHPLNVDGASLATSVSAPYGDPPYSTVIIRTPYGIPSKSEQVRQWTRRGYAVVVQDVRGRFASSGRWEPFANETSDGGALIDWVQRQSWSDANVLVYGSSYSAFCALSAATARPSAVVAVIVTAPIVSKNSIARESTGAPRFWAPVHWWSQHCSSTSGVNGMLPAHPEDLKMLRTLPAGRVGELVGGQSLPIDAWRIGPSLHSPNFETYQPISPLTNAGRLPPLLILCGVRDPLRDESIRLARTWTSSRCDLVLGVWSCDHNKDGSRTQIEPPLPPRNQRRTIGEFVSAWIRDVRINPSSHQRRTIVALEGETDWISIEEEPEKATTLPLHPVRRRFLAQPSNPHPSVLDSASLSPTTRRLDYAIFRSSPCTSEMDIVGTPRLSLEGLTTRNDPYSALDGPADWAFRLCVTRPANSSTNAAPRQISNTLARTSATGIHELSMPYVARRLLKGDYLEVHISAHQFPRYARGPQDGSDPLSAETLRAAHRAIGGGVELDFPQPISHRTRDPIRAVLSGPRILPDRDR